MRIVEQYTSGKSATVPSEDASVVTSSYAAVIDGATPKTSFRYPGGETPGHLAARLLAEAVSQLPDDIAATPCIDLLSQALHQEHVMPSDRPIASIVIYSVLRREVWMVGDCQFGYTDGLGTFHTVTGRKHIDRVLAEWRRDIITSYLSRGLMTAREIADHDPGRRIIQPFITHQVRYQNRDQHNPFCYAMLDGQPIPHRFIRVCHLPADVHTLVLATDGYPVLQPNLCDAEDTLQHLLSIDPLCIGPLLGTKGLHPCNASYDDRTYLKLQI